MKPWTFTDMARILRWAEHGHITHDGLQRIARAAPLPPTAADWNTLLDRLLSFGATVLLSAALICFFAFNWAELHRFVKFGLAFAALAAAVLAAMGLKPRSTGWHAALLAAALATGALFALIGQTYQTGADAWELFAAWAVLMLPFVLLSRTLPLWTLWLLIGNLALARGFAGVGDFGISSATGLLWMTVANLAFVALCESRGRWLAPAGTRSARRLLHLAGLALWLPLTLGACLAWDASEYRPLLFAHALCTALSLWRYHAVRRDAAMLGLMLYSGIAVGAMGLLSLDMHLSGGSLITIGLLVALASAAAATWLHAIANTHHDDEHEHEHEQA